MIWKGIVSFGVLLGIWTGLTYFAPQLSATPSTTLIESDPMSTYFLIANEGNNFATDGMGNHIAMAETNIIPVFRSRFPSKDKIGLPCLTFLKFQPLAKGDISIIVQYRPSFWPYRKSSEYRFRTQKGDGGKLYWIPEVAPFVFSPLDKPPN